MLQVSQPGATSLNVGFEILIILPGIYDGILDHMEYD